MPKRYKKSRRRRRRRSFKRRPANTILNKVRYFKHKCVTTGRIRIEGGNIGTVLTISRYDYAGLISNVVGINTPDRWA